MWGASLISNGAVTDQIADVHLLAETISEKDSGSQDRAQVHYYTLESRRLSCYFLLIVRQLVVLKLFILSLR